MPKKFHIQISQRDIELLTFLDQSPFTANQLFEVCSTLARPFGNPQNLRRRLRELSQANLIRSFPYAIATNGRSPNYCKLTRNGFQVLYGHNCQMPKRRYFEAIGDAHHHHTNSLAEFLVKLETSCHQAGFILQRVSRENSICLQAGAHRLFPDCTFQIATPSKTYNFVVELDNGTERVRSNRDVESIERKIRGYDLHQANLLSSDQRRFVVLFVTTRSSVRLDNMMNAVRECVQNLDRTLFLGTDLASFVASTNPLHGKAWTDHHGRRRMLIHHKRPSKNRPTLMTPALKLC